MFESGGKWVVMNRDGTPTQCGWQRGAAGWYETTQGLCYAHSVSDSDSDAEANSTWSCTLSSAPEASSDAVLYELCNNYWNLLVGAWTNYANREMKLNTLVDKVQPDETTRREWQEAADSLSEPRWKRKVEAWIQTYGELPTPTEDPPTALCVLTPMDTSCSEPESWILTCGGPDHINLYHCYEGVGSAPLVMRFPDHWALVRAPTVHSGGGVI